jgi:hypothetical protein
MVALCIFDRTTGATPDATGLYKRRYALLSELEVHSAICSSGMGMEKKLTTFMFVLTIGWRRAYRLFGITLEDGVCFIWKYEILHVLFGIFPFPPPFIQSSPCSLID